jgi:hypothetical protein
MNIPKHGFAKCNPLSKLAKYTCKVTDPFNASQVLATSTLTRAQTWETHSAKCFTSHLYILSCIDEHVICTWKVTIENEVFRILKIGLKLALEEQCFFHWQNFAKKRNLNQKIRKSDFGNFQLPKVRK